MVANYHHVYQLVKQLSQRFERIQTKGCMYCIYEQYHDVMI